MGCLSPGGWPGSEDERGARLIWDLEWGEVPRGSGGAGAQGTCEVQHDADPGAQGKMRLESWLDLLACVCEQV